MIALTAAQQAVFDSRQQGARWRVQVKDASGNWRDLTTWPGFNACVDAEVSTDVDADIWKATIHLRRAVEKASLAGMMEASPLNRAFAYPGTYAALLQPGREVKVDVAYIGADDAPDTWLCIFHGEMDDPDDSGPHIALECRDLGCRLQTKLIEVERVYGIGPTTAGVRVFRAGETYAAGELVTPSSPNGHYYSASAGLAGSEPTWPTGGGSTVVSGAVTFTQAGAAAANDIALQTAIQALLDDNFGAGVVTLYTPVSPAWNVTQWLQSRVTVMAAIKQLAETRGWNCRYKYDSGTSTWRLTLYGPDRAKVAVDQTFAPGRVIKTTQAKRSRIRVRNGIRQYFFDSTDLDANGDPKLKSVYVEDTASQAEWGDQYMEGSEEEGGHINTPTEASTYVNAMLADLKDPELGLGVELQLYPFVEPGVDLYRFTADGLRFSTDKDLALYSVTHSLKQKLRTNIVCTGRPCSGVRRHLRKEVRPGVADGHKVTLWNRNAKTVSATPVISGGRIAVGSAARDRDSIWDGIEVYVSETSGFTPSAGTLKYRGRSNGVTIADLKPGVTYYEKHIPYGFNFSRIVKGETSAETSFVAGYVHPKHLHPSMGETGMPLNGSFELYDVSNDRPECWEDDVGAFDNEWTLDHTISFDGSSAVKFEVSAVATAIRSLMFPVRPSTSYTVSTAFRPQAAFPGARTAAFGLRWYTSAGVLISTSTTNVALGSLTAGAFTEQTTALTSPSNAAFARAVVKKESLNTDFYFHADAVKVDPTPAAGSGITTPAAVFERSTAQTFNNNTVTQVDWPTQVEDTGGTVTGEGAGTWRMTPGVVGKYAVSARVLLDMGLNHSFEVSLDVAVNGTTVSRLYRDTGTTPNAFNGLLEIAGTDDAIIISNTTDYIEVFLYQVNSAAANKASVASFVAGTRISIRRVA